jgi:hypothetical protein
MHGTCARRALGDYKPARIAAGPGFLPLSLAGDKVEIRKPTGIVEPSANAGLYADRQIDTERE